MVVLLIAVMGAMGYGLATLLDAQGAPMWVVVVAAGGLFVAYVLGVLHGALGTREGGA